MATVTAIYLRQSKDRDDTEVAVDRQREACVALCKKRAAQAKGAERRQWRETEEYCDNNVSASQRSVVRKEYRRMLDDIRAGYIAGIVVWDLDRLYRQPRELEDLIDLADEHGLRLATVTGDVDLSNDNGRLFARIKGAVAKAEGERKGARQRAANEQAAKAGAWRAQSRPFGYGRDGEPLEPEAQALRDAYTDVLGGKSLRRVALDFNEAGLLTPNGRRWQSRNVRRTLLNPRYAGGSVHRGKVVATGTWTALVDKDTFNGVVALLSDPERAVCTTFERTWQGVGTYRCGCCGAPMKTQYQYRRRVYVCRATPHLLRQAEALDDHVSNTILERLSQPDVELLIESPNTDIPALQDRRASLVARKDKLGSLFAREIIDGEEYERAATELKARIAAIDGKLADAMRSSPVTAMLASGEDLRQRWEHMSASLRSQVIDELAVVTVLPCPPGQRRFDPDYIAIVWR